MSAGWRATYFGKVKAFRTGLSGTDDNVECVGTRCLQTFDGKTIADLNVTYAFTDAFSLAIGANNLFHTYPDIWNAVRDGKVGEAAS